MFFPFGQYTDLHISDVVQFDYPYCMWVLLQKDIEIKHPEFWQALQRAVLETPKQDDRSNLMPFGKYQGDKIEDFIHDKSYCEWLLSKDSFQSEYPFKYDYLQTLFNLIYKEQADSRFRLFYVLFFKNTDFIKVGITSAFIVKRIYNYFGIMTIYHRENIDFDKSVVYKTNCLGLEREVLAHFKNQRIDVRSERLQLMAAGDVDRYIHQLAEQKEFYFFKKPLKEFIPFDDGAHFRKSFKLKVNQFQDFETLYEEHLKEIGLHEMYNPKFLGMVN